VNWRPRAWLSGRLIAGIDFASRVDDDLCRREECTSFSGTLGNSKEGFKENNRTTFQDYTLDASLTASYFVSPVLRARTTAGVQYFQEAFRRNGAFGFGLPGGASTVTAGAIQLADEATTETKTLGAFVEQQFSLRERLYVTGALRADDNSAFGTEFSAVYYPKLTVSWVLSDEPFFPTAPWLSNLRVRGAVGASGQQPGSTDALPFYSPATAKLDDADRPALVTTEIGNTVLKPERATEIELGLDAALFENRASLEFTFYYKRTKDALIERILPPSSSITDRFENLGSVRNSGLEVAVRGILLNRPSVGWDVTVAGSYNSNELEDLGKDPTGKDIPPIVGTTIQQREGYPLDSYWLRPILGFNDLNGDGILEWGEVIVGDSAVFIGPNVPTTELTLATGFDLLNRRLRIQGLFDYKGGKYQLNGTERIRCESRLNCDGLVDRKAPLWKQARVVALREHPARTQWGFVEPVDFFRFRELSLTYTLPATWAGALRAQGASLTVAGRNLFRSTKYTGIDPETGYLDGGLQTDFQTQPPPTYWTARLNLTF
jgi:hypothetical protein